jgi:hypothetical protein
MPGTSTLAYLALSSAMKEKRFKTLTPDEILKTFVLYSMNFISHSGRHIDA